MSIFGQLLPSSTVETAALQTLGVWLPTYLAEVERQQNLTVPTLARPRSQQSSYDFQNWGEGQLPAVVCVCPGTVGAVELDGAAGPYQAWFELQAGVLVEDTTEANARRVSQLYQAAVEGVLIQRGSLGNVAVDTRLFARQSRLPDVENRTLAYAESTFHVFMEGLVTSAGGPPTPDQPLPDPNQSWPDWATVQETILDIEATRFDPEAPLPESDLFPDPELVP